MRALLPVLVPVLLAGCSYSGTESWRRSVCDPIVDADERERCLAEATRSEREYEGDVKEALEPAGVEP